MLIQSALAYVITDRLLHAVLLKIQSCEIWFSFKRFQHFSACLLLRIQRLLRKVIAIISRTDLVKLVINFCKHLFQMLHLHPNDAFLIHENSSFRLFPTLMFIVTQSEKKETYIFVFDMMVNKMVPKINRTSVRSMCNVLTRSVPASGF